MYASDNPNVPEGFTRGGMRYAKDNGVYTVFHAAHEDAHNMPNVLKALRTLMNEDIITKADLDEYARVRAENVARVRGAQPIEDRQKLKTEFACDLFGAVMYARLNKDDTIYASIGVSDEVARQAERAVLDALSYAPEVEHDLEVELSENADAAGDVEFSEQKLDKNMQDEIYDYSKSFAEQVDDWDNGKFPIRDTFILGGTPIIYQRIGFSALPMTMNQAHVKAALRGNDPDHIVDKGFLSSIPQLLEHPVAIIESKTRENESVVAIVSKKINGKQVVAAINIGGIGRSNTYNIDVNHISTVFGKGNALTGLLNDALIKEASGGTAIYYLNKKEALSLLNSAGVQFPGVLKQDGLIHSIFDAGSPVNRDYLEQTETRQFKRWFGKSKVVDKTGKPLVVYHGGPSGINVFRTSNSNDTGGAYFSSNENVAKEACLVAMGKYTQHTLAWQTHTL